jgi:glycerol uptake facilitator-like aquaporin
MLGEFVGTMMMILLGDGVVAAVLLKRSKAENSGWMVITTGWAFAVLCGIFTAILFGSIDGHLNPTITLAFAIQSGSFSKLLPYAVAQFAGGFCGAVLVWLFYLPHWRITEDPEVKRAIFCTAPAIRSYASNLFCEVVATFVLVLVAGSMSSKLVLATGAAAGPQPVMPSIQHATSPLVSRTLCCRLPEKRIRTGVMPGCRSSVPSSAPPLPDCCCDCWAPDHKDPYREPGPVGKSLQRSPIIPSD